MLAVIRKAARYSALLSVVSVGMLIFALLAGCGIFDKSAVVLGPKREFVVYKEAIVDATQCDSLEIDGDNANLVFHVWKNESVKFEIAMKMRGYASEEDMKKRIVNEYNTTFKKDKSAVVFDFRKGGRTEKPYDARIDADIYVPKEFKSLLVHVNNGEIKLIDEFTCSLSIWGEMMNAILYSYNGKINFSCDSGSLRVNNGLIKAGSSVKFNFGSININGSFEPYGRSTIETGTGNIVLQVPKDEPVNAECIGYVKQNAFTQADAFTQTEGISEIALKSGMGDIIINAR